MPKHLVGPGAASLRIAKRALMTQCRVTGRPRDTKRQTCGQTVSRIPGSVSWLGLPCMDHSRVEQPDVNRFVVGSSPTRGACKTLRVLPFRRLIDRARSDKSCSPGGYG